MNDNLYLSKINYCDKLLSSPITDFSSKGTSSGISEINVNIASAAACWATNSASADTVTLQNNATRSIETGRTAKGSYSSQKFENINEDFNTWAFKTEEFKILPMSCKPVTSEDIEKLYCCECGRKLKTKYKFCPYCGTKID